MIRSEVHRPVDRTRKIKSEAWAYGTVATMKG